MTKKIGLIDVGGTTIKLGVWTGTEVQKYPAIKTPATIENFYTELGHAVDQMKADHRIVGVGISSPGAVNKATGQIEGASAIPYIHYFDIHTALVEKFGLPVTIENDANCAALAEVADGAGKDVDNLIFMIIGTGIGGAIISNRQVQHGAHLFGGELGYMLMDDHQTLSELGSPVRLGKRYTARVNDGTTYDGKTVFDLAEQGNTDAQAEVQTMYQALAKAIYNLQYSFDPEKIILGGAVSNNPKLIPGVLAEIKKIRDIVEIAPFDPDVVACQYTDGANLRGAAVDFMNSYADLVK
ncbi:ROK family protein [Lactiplantibacillus fabifermentans]|uniref:Sugar kinase and transcription regulator n=2 Tax=Lactiplantibacillus fabifermentans TaxID=483011 RepID=A0A0R2NKX8_9LACO|nr:ROK family protein [Lactiplantibacillus fabifermentans]ETY72947.1 N-acetylmannosamine kinase [Lactiplantibacillus fabifermentans T30PCM01]KRO26422.1 sugar kinase and transcription regulator [Lactiplantibacillus fabifermentans DSM 21115]